MKQKTERTCGSCRWLDWDTDRCVKSKQIKTIDEEACRAHETKKEWYKRVFGEEMPE